MGFNLHTFSIFLSNRRQNRSTIKCWKFFFGIPPIYKHTVICRLNNEFLPKLSETKKYLHQDIVHKINRLSDELAKVSGTTITNRSHTEPKRKKEIKILRLYDPELEEK